MSELVLRLALQAMVDDAALPAFGDAVQVSGWKDGRERGFAVDMMGPSGWAQRVYFPMLSGESFQVGTSDSAAPTREYARAVAAVMLFGNWPASWPLAEKCMAGPSPIEQLDTLRRLYEGDILSREQLLELLTAEKRSPDD